MDLNALLKENARTLYLSAKIMPAKHNNNSLEKTLILGRWKAKGEEGARE